MAKPRKRGRAETSAEQVEKFLTALSDANTITEACKLSLIGRSAAYEMRERDKAFAAAWDGAFAAGTEKLESVARSRATDPVKGSDNLLMFLMKKRDPSYREAFKHEMAGPGGGPIPLQFIELRAVKPE